MANDSAVSGRSVRLTEPPGGLADVYGTVSYMDRPSRSSRVALFSCPVSTAGRSAVREAAICQAVVELLNEYSYDAVSMDAVAARAKASKATIYRRWSNKDTLVLHALRQFYSGADIAVPDSGTLREDLIGLLVGQLRDGRIAAANIAAVTALVYAAPNDTWFAGELRSLLQQVQATVLGTLLDRALARGELSRPVGVELVFEVAHAQFCSRSGMEPGEVDVQYVAHIVDDVLMPVIRHAGAAMPATTV